MTTRPKGKKFRIRKGFGSTDDIGVASARVSGPEEAASPAASTAQPATAEPARPDTRPQPEAATTEAPAAPSAKTDAPVNAPEPGTAKGTPLAPPRSGGRSPEDPEIDAIKAEGLTGRQLRMARRTALKHGITAASDYDAVRQLRSRGIDPFARSNMLELIVTDDEKASQGAGVPATRPGTEPAAPRAPGDALDANTRASEIYKVQQEIAKRRRRRLVLLATRLSFFVLLPTLIAAYYFFVIATPLYATHSAFKIDTADSGAAAGGGGLLSGIGLGNSTDSIVVQEYLESREAMLRLDEELGFRAHFSSRQVDPLIRLATDSTDEDMYDVYRRNLKIGFDPTEGLIRMEVRAADAETSQAFSEALIGYAEERVDQMSQRVREDQMAGARDSFEEAEDQLFAAQQRVLELQEQRGVLSADAELQAIMAQIAPLETQLQDEYLTLSELLSVARPNEARVEVSRQTIARLEDRIADIRAGLTEAQEDGVSLARVSSELIVAQADMETRQLILAQALQQMEVARIEANRQSLYLSMSVFPVPPDAAAYPKAFENTLLTLLVFSGIYLMLSMTASILREQISA